MSAAPLLGSAGEAHGGEEGQTTIADLAFLLWKRRLFIVLCTSAACLAGLVYAFTAPNVFHAEAVVAPKEQAGGGGGMPNILSGLGGIGSMVNAQLGLGNTKIERLEYIAKSREIAEYVIRRNSLLQRMFPRPKEGNPSAAMDSRDSLTFAIETLRSSIIQISADPIKNVLTIGADTDSPEFSVEMVNHYLAALNEKIKQDVQADADSNRFYLERQLGTTLDPMVREKILHLIAMEIERSMLVSTRSLDILQKPYPPLFRLKPLKRKILMTSFFIGLLLSVFLVFAFKGFRDLIAAVRTLEAGRPVNADLAR